MDARVIVGFCNVLTHEYAAVDDDAVYAVATEDLTTLRFDEAGLATVPSPEGYHGAIGCLAAKDPGLAGVVEHWRPLRAATARFP